jgi:putative solute:sodium symporter small subunit
MEDNDTHDDGDESPVQTDGGTVTQAAQAHRNTDYLNKEVNLLKPSTPFMRDHLRVVWTGFILWALIVFGPVTATAIAPDAMSTQIPILGFPLHYFLVALGAPTGALLLSVWYARKRDTLDEKYDIDPGAVESDVDEIDSAGDAAATDGGAEQ